MLSPPTDTVSRSAPCQTLLKSIDFPTEPLFDTYYLDDYARRATDPLSRGVDENSLNFVSTVREVFYTLSTQITNEKTSIMIRKD